MLRTDELDRPEATGPSKTAVGVVIDAGSPATSDVMDRIRSRDPWWDMPALGSEVIDEDGARIPARWIRDLGR
jgi:hypothetical protein